MEPCGDGTVVEVYPEERVVWMIWRIRLQKGEEVYEKREAARKPVLWRN